MRIIGLVSLLLLLTSCSQSMQLTAGTPTPETVSCARTGGFLAQRGRRGNLMCVHPFVDAGKSCSSKSDCKGRCIAKTDGPLPEAGASAAGMCQADDRLFGCFAEIDKGKVKSSMCID
ncbi:hypothetical protein [Sphingobium nicotianae]|uniref:Secreted protein n=1 Tax=Sphingobium nicotianae TaxID=2782607 RepID=A0A9X1DD40_9SPHN|nr:hypothetical protein [Sphingobium nicotianae]MBT2187685.1 hypothetical protein [Sphingobium nicotianae]